jgi:hypothetical protein
MSQDTLPVTTALRRRRDLVGEAERLGHSEQAMPATHNLATVNHYNRHGIDLVAGWTIKTARAARA